MIIGNPNMEERRLESVIEMPRLLSFLTSRRWDERLTGSRTSPGPLARLGAARLLRVPHHGGPRHDPARDRRRGCPAAVARPPLPVAGDAVDADAGVAVHVHRHIAGWTTAETGRQPWVVDGLLRTRTAPRRPSRWSGTALFTLLGFAGLYTLLALLFVLLMARIVGHGPEDIALTTTSSAAARAVSAPWRSCGSASSRS